MTGLIEHGAGGSLFDDSAEIHDPHAVGYMAHYVQVMRDYQNTDAEFSLELAQQVQNFTLYRYVEARGRFIRDNQFRV